MKLDCKTKKRAITPWNNPILRKLRQYREEYSQNFNFDLNAISADVYSRREEQASNHIASPVKTADEIYVLTAEEERMLDEAERRLDDGEGIPHNIVRLDIAKCLDDMKRIYG